MLCDDYVSIIADGASVSTFLCTRNLVPEEVRDCTETDYCMKYSLKGSKWWLPRVWNSTTYYIYFLKIPASYLYCFCAIYNSLHSSWWSVSESGRSFYTPRPLIDWPSQNDATSLTTYTMHTCTSDTNINVYKYIYIVRTRGKAIVEMALWAIIKIYSKHV